MLQFVAGVIRRGGLTLQWGVVAFIGSGSVLGIATVLAGLAVAWGGSYAMGGSQTAMPHLFYLPIIFAAVRFSWAGALTASIAAGLLAGPALPADVPAGIDQDAEGWVLRLLIFMLVGTFVAWLLRGRVEPIAAAFQDSLISRQLLRGIRSGEIEVHYQPLVDLETGRVTSLEALARWNHPSRGRIGPDVFIPQAERTGAITALDRHVLRTAARQVQRWRTELAPVTLSVNVSSTRFAERDLPTDVRQALEETGLEPSSLQLEITESAIIADIEGASVQLDSLRASGVRIAIDDFGAGESSFGHLNRFRVDTVKIDRSLVAQFPAEPRAKQLLAGMVGLFHALDLAVVAEGVETAEQYVHLEAIGCERVQGFFVGAPLSAREVTAVLTGPRAPQPVPRRVEARV